MIKLEYVLIQLIINLFKFYNNLLTIECPMITIDFGLFFLPLYSSKIR